MEMILATQRQKKYWLKNTRFCQSTPIAEENKEKGAAQFLASFLK